MTPYTLAFTVFRIIAVWRFLRSLYLILGFIDRPISEAHLIHPAFSDVILGDFVPAVLLFAFAGYLARATVWKIKD